MRNLITLCAVPLLAGCVEGKACPFKTRTTDDSRGNACFVCIDPLMRPYEICKTNRDQQRVGSVVDLEWIGVLDNGRLALEAPDTLRD